MRAALHLSKYPAERGGMDNVLRLHANAGAPTLALLTRPDASRVDSVLGRIASMHAPLAWLRARFSSRMARGAAPVALYYNAWGADVLARCDGAERRFAYLHNFFPAMESFVRHFAPHVDGFICVSPAMHAAVVKVLPEKLAPSCVWVPYPIGEEFFSSANEAREPVIGFSGRLLRNQKRIDRLPELVAALDASGRDYLFEIAGDGPDRGLLETQLRSHPRVRWLRWLEPAALAARMSRWRYSVNVSDYEGQSLACLESMAAGCIPLYPDFHAGTELPGELHGCLYARGEMAALVRRWSEFESAGENARVAFAMGLRRYAEQHRPDRHLTELANAIDVLAIQPRRCTAQPRSPLAPWSPIWRYNRFYRDLTGS